MAITLNGSGGVTGLTALPDSAMASGSILQIQSVTKTDTASVTDNATPQDISGLSIAITPASSSSKFYITGKVQFSVWQAANHSLHINVNGSLVGQPSAVGSRHLAHAGLGYVSTGQQYAIYPVPFDLLVDASDGNEHTIKLQFAQSNTGHTRTLYVNRQRTDSDSSSSGNRFASTLTVMEIAG